jgi:hypothetical protein
LHAERLSERANVAVIQVRNRTASAVRAGSTVVQRMVARAEREKVGVDDATQCEDGSARCQRGPGRLRAARGKGAVSTLRCARPGQRVVTARGWAWVGREYREAEGAGRWRYGVGEARLQGRAARERVA